MEMLGRSQEVALWREIDRVDDECVAVPTAARVAAPLADASGQMRSSIKWNDAGLMTRFHEQDHLAPGLHNLVIRQIACAIASTEPRHAPGDAPECGAEIFRTVRALRGGRRS